jgi:hypothetical protein
MCVQYMLVWCKIPWGCFNMVETCLTFSGVYVKVCVLILVLLLALCVKFFMNARVNTIKIFFFSITPKPCSGVHPTSHSISTDDFSREWSGRNVKSIAHLKLMPKLIMTGFVPLFSLCAFKGCTGPSLFFRY